MKEVLDRKVFSIPDKGTFVLELNDYSEAMYTINGTKPDGSVHRLGFYTDKRDAIEDFKCAVDEYSEYLTEEYSSDRTV